MIDMSMVLRCRYSVAEEAAVDVGEDEEADVRSEEEGADRGVENRIEGAESRGLSCDEGVTEPLRKESLRVMLSVSVLLRRGGGFERITMGGMSKGLSSRCC
jgi:hypothetical protein